MFDVLGSLHTFPAIGLSLSAIPYSNKATATAPLASPLRKIDLFNLMCYFLIKNLAIAVNLSLKNSNRKNRKPTNGCQAPLDLPFNFHNLMGVMPTFRASRSLCFFLIALFQINNFIFSQTSGFPINEWVKNLNTKDVPRYQYMYDLMNFFNRKYHDEKDTSFISGALNQLEKRLSTNHYFNGQFYLVKAHVEYAQGKSVEQAKKFCEMALQEAYQTEDDDFIAQVCWFNGDLMGLFQEIDLNVSYTLLADEIIQHLEKKPFFLNALTRDLGETFYHTRQYDKSVDYLERGLAGWHDTIPGAEYYRIRYLNSLGQAYKQLGQLDSAMVNYQRSMEFVNKYNELTWRGINNVFMGEIYFLRKDYTKAKRLIQDEYKVKYTDEPNVSAYGLRLLAKIDLAQGRYDSALLHINQALQLLRNHNFFPLLKANYLELTYHTAADVHRVFDHTDSFYHYSSLYATLHDSLERVATRSHTKMAGLRIQNARNYQTIHQIRRQKEAEEQKRNLIIAILIALSVIIILILNRQKEKLKYKEKLALQERTAAKEQLENFTQNLIEKTMLIEKLETQVKANEYNAEQQQLVEELTHQAILTEDDWLKFKMLFEKTNPGFFTRLKTIVNDISLAEQRMAALTRLNLTTKQKAAVLGISPNSIIKAKQRLRDRFKFATDTQVEEFLTSL